MASGFVSELREFGRGVVGALLFGSPLLFTMETWWLGWTLPAGYVIAYVVIGLLLVLALTRAVGFRREEAGRETPLRRLVPDFLELLTQAFVASYAVLLLTGVLRWGDSLGVVLRTGAMQIVPLGLGAALANSLLASSDANASGTRPFPRDVAVFALGAVFFTFPIAPTEEIELIAARMGWDRMAALVVASVAVTYLALYELEFRGRAGRVASLGSGWLRLGETCLVYVVAVGCAAMVLTLFGHFIGGPSPFWVQGSVVLGFPATLGGSAARVVL